MFLMHLSHSVVTLAQYGMPSDRHHQDIPHTAVTLSQHGMPSDRHHQDVPHTTVTLAQNGMLSDSHHLDVPHNAVSAESISFMLQKRLKFKLFSKTENITGSCYLSLLVREHKLRSTDFWIESSAL